MIIKGMVGEIIQYLHDGGVRSVTLIDDRIMFSFGGSRFDISIHNIICLDEFEETLAEIIKNKNASS